MLTAKREDIECQKYAATVGLSTSTLDFNKDGLFVHRSPLDGPSQKVVPTSLHRVICLSQRPPKQGHNGENKTDQKLRRSFYTPFIASDVSTHIHDCRSYAKAKDRAHMRHQKRQVLSPTGQLDDVAIELLGLLSKTRNDNQYFIVIIDWYRTIACAVPIPMKISLYIAAVMLNHWTLPYGIPNSTLSENSHKFIV